MNIIKYRRNKLVLDSRLIGNRVNHELVVDERDGLSDEQYNSFLNEMILANKLYLTIPYELPYNLLKGDPRSIEVIRATMQGTWLEIFGYSINITGRTWVEGR